MNVHTHVHACVRMGARKVYARYSDCLVLISMRIWGRTTVLQDEMRKDSPGA